MQKLNLCVSILLTIPEEVSNKNEIISTFQGIDIMRVRDQTKINIESYTDTITFNIIEDNPDTLLFTIYAKFNIDENLEDIPTHYAISRIQFGIDNHEADIQMIHGIWDTNSDDTKMVSIYGSYQNVVDQDVW